jgi:hypothetical protein
MPRIARRTLLQLAAGSCLGGWTTASQGQLSRTSRRVAAFRVDVTPPLGHPLLGGGFRPAAKIGDPLYAHGLVFTGDDRPIVYVAVDWCELRNEAYARWRDALAAAVDTTIERVLVSCVHQHDAPYVDLGAQRILGEAGIAQRTCDPEFHEQAVQKVATAAKAAPADAKPLTHLGRGRARVEQIASNRRVLKPDGTPYFGRYSTCRDEKLRDQPEGEVDPWLRSLTFYSHDTPIATLHSYAVHPMSPYGGGVVSADFVGDARARRQRDLPDVVQIYATGCAGDVTAGKYNDGGSEVRGQLAGRLYDAMVHADAASERVAIDAIAGKSKPITLPFWNTQELTAERLRQIVADEKHPFMPRAMAALGLSSLECSTRRGGEAGHRVDLQVVDFGAAQLALFPAESFVSFQLQVQQAQPDKFILPIGFGECAPGYIPTVAAVREGFREEHGYCWVDETAERHIVEGMNAVLQTDRDRPR